MPSKHDPADCLADIVENAEWIESHIAGMDRSDFEMNCRMCDTDMRSLPLLISVAVGDADSRSVDMLMIAGCRHHVDNR